MRVVKDNYRLSESLTANTTLTGGKNLKHASASMK